MAWKIELSATARKQFAKLGSDDARRISSFLRERVAESGDPRTLGKALQGPLKGSWAYRVGDHRVICTILDAKVTIVVIEIGHRREVYR